MAESASVENSLVTVGCDVAGKLDYSVLFENVTVEEGATVEYALVMPGSVIKRGATVRYAIVAENVVVEENAVIGESPEEIDNLENWGVTVIGEKVTIDKGATVKAKEMIDEDIKEVK